MTTTAVITGSNGGIGVALTLAFRNAGYLTLGIDRSPGEFTNIVCDLDHFDAGALGNSVDQVTASPVSVLINNAAVQTLANFADLSPEDWRQTFEVNVLAPVRLSQLFLPQLIESNGSVINVGSIHAHLTKAQFTAYATSKSALAGFTRAAATELASQVRFNTIEPAAVNTPMLREGFEGDPEAFASLAEHHPMARIGEPEEIANLAVFLASDQARFINGASIGIDGAIAARLHDPN